MLGTKYADLELADRDKAVVTALLELNEAGRGALLTGLTVLADAGVLNQQFEEMSVVLEQASTREAGGKLLDYFIDLVLLEPRIDDLELLAEYGEHHDISEVVTVAVGRVLFVVEVDDLPAEVG